MKGDSMTNFKRIVLTTDLSTDADFATPYAVELARTFGGSIDLLHAFEEARMIQSAVPDMVGIVSLDWVDESRKVYLERLAKLSDLIGRTYSVPVCPVQLDGNTADVVASYARREKADCIVTATHGRSGFSHVMFGSVAEKIIQFSSCPVLTIKPDPEQKKPAPKFKVIVMATDFSLNSDAAKPYVLELVKRYGATLHVIHVFENDLLFAQSGVESTPHYEEVMRTEHAWREERLKNYARGLGATELGVIHTVGKGQPAAMIAKYAREVGADCIVIATHGRTGFAHLLIGSVAERVVRLAPCPVLCVKPETIVTGKSETAAASSAV